MIFLEGYLTGLSMIVFIGPVFFLLVSVSLESGTIPGILVAGGIIAGDFLYVMFCFFGAVAFIDTSGGKTYFAIAGGALLVVLGIKYIIQKDARLVSSPQLRPFHYLKFFINGFLVNFVNPFVFIVWLGVVAFSKETFRSPDSSIVFLSGTLCGILSTDLLKVFAARKIKQFLVPEKLRIVYRISGVVLVLFGIRMIVHFV